MRIEYVEYNAAKAVLKRYTFLDTSIGGYVKREITQVTNTLIYHLKQDIEDSKIIKDDVEYVRLYLVECIEIIYNYLVEIRGEVRCNSLEVALELDLLKKKSMQMHATKITLVE